MMIPDCRTDEAYNEKYLNENDSAEIRGYDWCAEEVVDSFFDNIEAQLNPDSMLMHVLNMKLPECMKSEYVAEFRFEDRTPETRKVETYLDLLRSNMLDWIENERDELITSMIDSMDDDEYDAIKEKVDGQNKDQN